MNTRLFIWCYQSVIICIQSTQEMYQESLLLESTGCATVLQLITSTLSGSLDVKKTGDKGDWLVFNKAINQTDKSNESFFYKYLSTPLPILADDHMVPEGVAKFLKQLIKRQPVPVFVETLPLLYKVRLSIQRHPSPLAKLDHLQKRSLAKLPAHPYRIVWFLY